MEEVGVSLSPARPLSRLSKVGRGRAGISVLGEGIPGARAKGGGSPRAPRKARVPRTPRYAHAPAREPSTGARAGRSAQGLAVIPSPPSPGFGRSANSAAPPAPPGSCALWSRTRDLWAKSIPPPACPGWGLGRGGGEGFPGTRSCPRFSPDLSEGGTASPSPGTGLRGVRTRGAGRTRCGSGRLRLAPRPAAARTLASPFPQRTSTPRWASVGRGLSRVLRGPLESFLAQGRENVRSQSGQKVPSSVGLASGRLPPAGPAPRAPLHCPAGYFIHSRR